MSKTIVSYVKQIDKIIEKLKKELVRRGNYENFGQKEYRKFREEVDADDNLSYAVKANLCKELADQIHIIQ